MKRLAERTGTEDLLTQKMTRDDDDVESQYRVVICCDVKPDTAQYSVGGHSI